MLVVAALVLMSFTELPLPDGVRVPIGAFRSSILRPRPLIMRSRHDTPLKEQVASWKETADIVEDELVPALVGEEKERIYMNSCFSSGLFEEEVYKKHLINSSTASERSWLVKERSWLVRQTLDCHVAAAESKRHKPG